MIGRVVSHYRIVELIGDGGMGDVYRADDLSLPRSVAIKVLKPAAAEAEAGSRRFLREARALCGIDDPNVVPLFEVFEEGRTTFMVMQFVEGRSLASLLRDERPTLDRSLDIAGQIARGLDAAHRCSIIHRDLKPDNVMITDDGRCKVLDFGIALLGDHTLTTDGHLMGTLPYMAPEQLAGDEIDARADVYALGVVLFQMLTGSRPFEAQDGPALIHNILHRPAPPLRTLEPALPESLERIVAKALAKEPARRYPGMRAMLDDIELVRQGLPIPRPGILTRITHEWVAPLTSRWPLAATMALVVVAGIAAALALRRDEPSSRPKVMVVRWENATGDPALDWLSGGIMDGLIHALSRLQGVDVIARETVSAALASAPGAVDVPIHSAGISLAAKRTGATYLAQGRFRRSNGRLRVECELIDLVLGHPLGTWSREIDLPPTDFDAVIETLAGAVAGVLDARYAPGDGSPRITASLDALEHYQRALDHIEAQDFAGGVEELRASVATDSTFPDAYLLLARYVNEDSASQIYLTEAMKYRHKASTETAALIEAMGHENHGHLEDAIARYKEVLAANPEQPYARTSLARLYLGTRRYVEADAEYQVLHSINPFDFSFYPAWETALREIGQNARLFALIDEWKRDAPESLSPLFDYVQAHQLSGNYEAALAWCDSLAARAPGSDGALRAFVLLDLGRVAEAESLFQALAREDDPRITRGRGWSYLAYSCLRKKEFARGETFAAKALAIEPDPYNYWLAGLLAAGKGDESRALACAESIARTAAFEPADSLAAESFTDRRFYYHLQGAANLAAQQYDLAVDGFRRSVHDAGRSDTPFFGTWLGLALLENDEPEDAAQEFERVLEINPRYPEALLYLGRAKCESGRSAEARKPLQQLARLWIHADPGDPLNRELNRLLVACSP